MSIYDRNTDHCTHHWITDSLAHSYASTREGTVNMSTGSRIERALRLLDSRSQECAHRGEEDGEDDQVYDLRSKTS